MTGSAWKFRCQPTAADFNEKQIDRLFRVVTFQTRPSLAVLPRLPPNMQAPVIVMNDASARQTGRKAQTSNITAAKVSFICHFI
jgi:hypothetical protein